MNKLLIFLTILLAVMLFSCASYNIYSDTSRGADFSKYKTYAWLPDVDTGHGKSFIDNDILRKNMEGAINSEMQSLHYTLDTIHPDALLIVHTMFTKREENVNTSLYSSYPYYYTGISVGTWYPYYWSGYAAVPFVYGNDMHTVQFTQGSIAIDIIDRQSNKLLWRGWTEEDIYNPAEFENTLDKKIHAIFQKYPGNHH